MKPTNLSLFTEDGELKLPKDVNKVWREEMRETTAQPFVHRKWSHDEIALLMAYRKEGKTIKEIAQKLKRTVPSVQFKWDRLREGKA